MILNDNSTQQINTLVIQLQNRITNLNNEFNKKVSKINDEISDLDTLKKEIADLVKDQINVDSSMNKQITENKNNIAANSSSISELNTQIQTNRDNIATNTSDIATLKTSVAGKADKSHTHTKSEITDFPTSLKNPNALTVNGKTYDGSSAVDAGVQTVANGGTGVTTQAEINKAFIGNLEEGESDVTDGTEFVSSWASDNGFAETEGGVNTPYKRKFIKVWNYIKGKADSVYAKANRYYFNTHNVYRCLGTATLRQGGDYLLIRVFSGHGYNAILGQDRAFDIHLRTSNGRDLNGLYYAGYVEYHLNGSSSSLVYVVQNSATSFTIWVGLTNYTGRSFYTVENSDGSSWSSSTETSTSLPSGAAQLTAKQIAYNTEDVTFNSAKASNKMVIPIGAPSQLEDGCIWIER